MRFFEYSGMSYSQASREAARTATVALVHLLPNAVESQRWIDDLPERLIALREIMRVTRLLESHAA